MIVLLTLACSLSMAQEPVEQAYPIDYGAVQEQAQQMLTAIDAIEDALTTDTLGYQFTLQQTTAQNENFRLEWGHSADAGLLLEETDGDNIVSENDSSSVGENILLEYSADAGHGGWLLQEDYIVGDFDQPQYFEFISGEHGTKIF